MVHWAQMHLHVYRKRCSLEPKEGVLPGALEQMPFLRCHLPVAALLPCALDPSSSKCSDPIPGPLNRDLRRGSQPVTIQSAGAISWAGVELRLLQPRISRPSWGPALSRIPKAQSPTPTPIMCPVWRGSVRSKGLQNLPRRARDMGTQLSPGARPGRSPHVKFSGLSGSGSPLRRGAASSKFLLPGSAGGRPGNTPLAVLL